MNIYIESLIDTLYFTGVIILVGFALGKLRNATLTNFQKTSGGKVVALTAFIGVPIHELGHLIFAIIFRHKIGKVRLLQFKRNDNTLGYVEHSSNPLSIYQQLGNFFIGIGPIIGGTLSIILLMRLLLPSLYQQFIELSILNLDIDSLNMTVFVDILSSYGKIMSNMFNFENITNLNFIIFLLLSISISSHISLSKPDIQGAFKGLFLFYILVVAFNYFGLLNSFQFNLMKYNVLLTSFLAISMFFSITTYLISLLFTLIIRNP